MNGGERIAVAFLGKHPDRAARLLESMDATQAAEVIRAAPASTAAPVLQKMLPTHSARCAAELSAAELAKLLVHISTPSAAAILRQVPPDTRDEALRKINRAYAAGLKMLFRYPTYAVGAWMDPRVITLAHDYSVAEARASIDEVDYSVSRIFVLDRDRHLRGAIPVHVLRHHDGGGPITPLLVSTESISARESITAAMSREIWERESQLPVTNRHDEFIGAISYTDLRKGQRHLRKAGLSGVTQSRESGIAELFLTGLDCTWRNVEDLIIRDHAERDKDRP